jgi:hypothetical protein
MSYAPSAPEEQKTTRSTAQTRAAKQSKRTLGEDAAPAPGHSTKNLPRDFRKINGWGVDLDPKNRPAVPRELPSDVKTVRGDVEHWQVPHVKIFMSNEQPGLTPVFGEAQPPRGLSGLLREYAYQFGEGTNRHWMTLMMANRVDVMESAIIDALKGKPDNYVKEKGWAASIRNRGEERSGDILMVGAAALTALAVGLVLKTVLSDD